VSILPLVVVERGLDGPTRGSIGLLAIARALAGSAAALVVGQGAEETAATIAAHGADVIYVCEIDGLVEDFGQPHVDVLTHLVRERGHDLVLFENSGVTSDAASGLAVRLDAGVNWDLQSLTLDDGAIVGTRLALNDTTEVRVGWNSAVRLAVFRVGQVEPVPADGAGRIERITPSLSPVASRARVVERRRARGEGANLSSADVIVSGGRGVRDAESLALLEDLAAALGGAVAVSMPLVDRGWRPHSMQVGQTGQKVRPRLYVACGISGQLAHRVGMEKSGLIVAINTDRTAPIFGICDAGVVGDLHQVLPELTRRVREARDQPLPETQTHEE